jgi:4-alpha-glucanotransferase
LPETLTPEVHEALLGALFRSESWLAVVMITDLFARSERFNLPGVATSANWSQRVHEPTAYLQREPGIERLRALLRETGRAVERTGELAGPQAAQKASVA